MATSNGQQHQLATQISDAEKIRGQDVEQADIQLEPTTAPQQHVENTHRQNFPLPYPASSATEASSMQIEHQQLETIGADSSAIPAAQQKTKITPVNMARAPTRSTKRRKQQDKWDASEILKSGSPLGQGNMKVSVLIWHACGVVA